MQAPNRHVTRLVVMASGTGSNLQAILDACTGGELDAEVVAVVSDKDNAYALKRAADAGVPSVHVGCHPGEDRAEYDTRLADVVSGFAPDLIVLAGWMRILTNAFLGWFPDEVINLHPALPGELPGTRAVERAWHEALAGERTRTGVMVHRVPDEGVDNGPVLASVEVPINLDDTFESLLARIHAAEHHLLVDAIKGLIAPSGPDALPPEGSPTDNDEFPDDTKATST
jgi:phosphoribosylglycinamide formyltransferase-1